MVRRSAKKILHKIGIHEGWQRVYATAFLFCFLGFCVISIFETHNRVINILHDVSYERDYERVMGENYKKHCEKKPSDCIERWALEAPSLKKSLFHLRDYIEIGVPKILVAAGTSLVQSLTLILCVALIFHVIFRPFYRWIQLGFKNKE